MTHADTNGTVINKYWPIQRALVVIIILLHALITINFAANWSYNSSSSKMGKIFGLYICTLIVPQQPLG